MRVTSATRMVIISKVTVMFSNPVVLMAKSGYRPFVPPTSEPIFWLKLITLLFVVLAAPFAVIVSSVVPYVVKKLVERAPTLCETQPVGKAVEV